MMRKVLGVEPEKVSGRYGEFVVLVDGETVVDGGALAFLGMLPSAREVLEKVRDKLGAAGQQA